MHVVVVQYFTFFSKIPMGLPPHKGPALTEKSFLAFENILYTVKKSVDFTAKYLLSSCHFFYRYFYGRLITCRTFLEINIW